MSVDISRADRNYGIAGMNGSEQVGGGSTCAPMMRNFEQHRVRVLLHHAPLRRTLRVSLKQGGGCAESSRKDQAVIVGTHRPSNLIPPRSQHSEMRSAVVKFIAFFFHRDFHSGSLGLCHDRRERANGVVDAYPELLRMEICNDRWHPAEVVGVRMRDGDNIEMI